MTEITGRVGWRTFVPTNNPLWDNLLAYWSGDNTANDAKGTYNGTLVNGATYSTGKISNGFSLDGVNDYVDLGLGYRQSKTEPFTYNFWASINSLGTLTVLSNSGDNGHFCYIESGYIWMQIGFSGGGYLRIRSTSTIPLNTLKHITITYDGSASYTSFKIYINGVSNTVVGSTNTLGSYDTPNPSAYNLNIGRRPAGQYYFSGILDEIAIWSRALTAADATELYNGGAGKQYVAPTPTYPIITNGLSLYYDISNPLSYAGSGTTLNDLSGNANTATLYNGVGYSSSNGGILTLDGINDYISAPHSTSLVKTSTGALFIWVKLNVAAPFRGYLVAKGVPFTNRSAYGIWQYDYQEGVSICSASTMLELGISYPPSTWRQVGMVWNGTTLKKYVNGVEVASVAQTINVNDIGSILRIGQYVNMNFGELYLYDTLTPTQITTNFNATKTRYGL